jgi:predicted Zn-dependent protease
MTTTSRPANGPRRNWRALALMAALLLPLATGCSVNPATGRQSFTGCLSEADERQIGAENHPVILQEFGGEYEDPQLKAYVNEIGQKLAASSDRPNVRYTFTVLDSPVVNAFAVPGGYIYVTRGLVALAQNQAELAGVVAHEIGHIAAKHTNERYCRALVAQLGIFGLGAATGSNAIAEAANLGAAIYLQSYSRDQEFEADLLGVRYLGRGAYDPNAMSTFLATLLESSRLDAALAGRPGTADQFSIFQTHPRTADRVQRAVQQAAGAQPVTPASATREAYLDHIDGILYGDDPEEGFIRGRRFAHPVLRFEFTVPDGFTLFNSSTAVIASGPNNSVIQFDREPQPQQTGDMQRYIREQWASGIQLADLDPITVNGLDAAIGEARVATNAGQRDAWLVAVRWNQSTIYRFVLLAQPGQLGAFRDGFNRTLQSFRPLSASEAAALKPQRIEIVTVGSGDTVESMAARMPFSDYRVERFRVLNALPANATLTPGQRVKIVVE